MTEEQEEMKCPKCGGDMKEYASSFRCRKNGNDGKCDFIFKLFFNKESSGTESFWTRSGDLPE